MNAWPTARRSAVVVVCLENRGEPLAFFTAAVQRG